MTGSGLSDTRQYLRFGGGIVQISSQLLIRVHFCQFVQHMEFILWHHHLGTGTKGTPPPPPTCDLFKQDQVPFA